MSDKYKVKVSVDCGYCNVIERDTNCEDCGGEGSYWIVKTIPQETIDDIIGDAADTIEALQKDNAELLEAVKVLVNMYVRNQGTDSEFITCITPPGAYSLKKADRKADKTWKAWDKARDLLTRFTPPKEGDTE